MSHHDLPDKTMHVDDQVATGVSRRTAGLFVGVGLFIAGIAAAGLFVILGHAVEKNRSSNALTRSEVQAVKALLAERKTQRDDEAAQVQDQLSKQAAVLCVAIGDFRAGARGPGLATLDKAYAALKCGSPSTPTSLSSTSAPSGATPTPASTARHTGSAATPRPRSTTPPAAAKPPAPVPTPPAPPAAPAPAITLGLPPVLCELSPLLLC